MIWIILKICVIKLLTISDFVKKYRLKIAAIMLLMLPLGFLLIFAFGETLGGDISGLGHLLQAAPIALCAMLGLKYPKGISKILIVSGLILGLFYIRAARHFSLTVIIMVELVLFIPLIGAGILLYLSSRKGETLIKNS